MWTRTNKPANFTLVELLIAISLFAAIIVSLYSALSVGIVAWKRGDQGSSTHQKARIILDTMVSDVRDCVYFSYIQFVGKAQEVYFPTTLVVSEANKKAKATFDTNIFKITYSLEKQSYRDKYKTLMRKQETFLQSLEPTKVKPKQFASDIVELKFQYPYKIKEEEQVELDGAMLEWKNEWKLKDKIPMFIKIKVVLLDKSDIGKDQKKEYERTVFIPHGTLEEEPLEDEF